MFFFSGKKKTATRKLRYLSAQTELGPQIWRACREYHFLTIFREKIFFSTRWLIFFGGGGGINFGQLKLLLKIVDFHLKSIISRCDFALKSHQIHRKSSFYLLEVSVGTRKTFSSMYAVMKLADLKSHHP